MSEPKTLDALSITPIRVPASVDDLHDGRHGDFLAAVDVRNRVGAVVRGDDAVTVSAEQVLPQWHSTDEDVLGWILRHEGAVAGRALLYVLHEEGSQRAQLRVEVLPEFDGRGIGTRALAFLEERAREHGRPVLQAWTEHPPRGGEQLTAATGFGAVPTDAACALLTRAGYRLEQVYRISTLDLGGDVSALEPLREAAIAASEGYRYVSWLAPTPDEWIDDYAWIKSRMSTDAPSGDAVIDEEVWDAARLRRMEERNAASGMTMLVGAAQHIASGRLVAFTELVSFEQEGTPIDQNDTLVLSEHRGHRLGALVKTETLLRAREQFAGDRIITGNAEENRPMLSINESMGFVPTRYSGDWQKIVG